METTPVLVDAVPGLAAPNLQMPVLGKIEWGGPALGGMAGNPLNSARGGIGGGFEHGGPTVGIITPPPGQVGFNGMGGGFQHHGTGLTPPLQNDERHGSSRLDQWINSFPVAFDQVSEHTVANIPLVQINRPYRKNAENFTQEISECFPPHELNKIFLQNKGVSPQNITRFAGSGLNHEVIMTGYGKMVKIIAVYWGGKKNFILVEEKSCAR